MQLSTEQQNVINAVADGYNVVVSGVAGCGKTTTILNLCQSFPMCKVLVLTYNSRLKHETRDRAAALNLKNAEIHSFHALCYKYYTEKGATDAGIILTVKKNIVPNIPIAFNILVIDECQDMTKLYFDLVRKLLIDNITCTKDNVQIALLGDEQQNIFHFKKADERFLTLGPRIFPSTREWKLVTTHTSFRVTNQIAHFINKYLNGFDKIKAIRDGAKVTYMYVYAFDEKIIFQQIKKYMKLGYKEDDIFILAPSTKKKNTASPSPIVRLENLLVSNGFLCYAPVNDDVKVDEEVCKGKIVFSSFHQIKGLERKVVIVYGFDASYFKYYAPNLPDDNCPNTIYVATTRAMEHLCVVHNYTNQPLLPHIDMHKLSRDPNIEFVTDNGSMNKLAINQQNKLTNNNIRPVAVTDLVRFLEPQDISKAVNMLKYTTSNSQCNAKVILPQTVEGVTKGTKEVVCDINGYAIPALFELNKTHTCQIIEDCYNVDFDDEKDDNTFSSIKQKYIDNTLNIDDMLYIATLYDAYCNGFVHRVKQIKSFDWLNTDIVHQCLHNLEHSIGCIANKHVVFEKGYGFQAPPFDGIQFSHKYKLRGRVDCINYTDGTLWELKCTTATQIEHIIQLACYAWLQNTVEPQEMTYSLLNICTGELITLTYDHEKTMCMIDYLLKCKYEKKHGLSDEAFIQQCNHIITT